MGQIEPLVTDLCHGLREHFERHTVAVSPANAGAGMAGQRVVQLFLDPGGATGVLEGMAEAVEHLPMVGDAEIIGVPRPPLRPVSRHLPGDGWAQPWEEALISRLPPL